MPSFWPTSFFPFPATLCLASTLIPYWATGSICPLYLFLVLYLAARRRRLVQAQQAHYILSLGWDNVHKNYEFSHTVSTVSFHFFSCLLHTCLLVYRSFFPHPRLLFRKMYFYQLLFAEYKKYDFTRDYTLFSFIVSHIFLEHKVGERLTS